MNIKIYILINTTIIRKMKFTQKFVSSTKYHNENIKLYVYCYPFLSKSLTCCRHKCVAMLSLQQSQRQSMRR